MIHSIQRLEVTKNPDVYTDFFEIDVELVGNFRRLLGMLRNASGRVCLCKRAGSCAMKYGRRSIVLLQVEGSTALEKEGGEKEKEKEQEKKEVVVVE